MNAQTKPEKKFSEYLGGFEQNSMSMRLGHTVYVEQGKDIFAEDRKTGELQKVTLEEQVAKPWIRQNFDRERAFQEKKAMAIRLESAFERRYPPSRKRAKGSLFWANSH